MERLSRLVDLANSWGGPISAAVVVNNISADVPLVVDTWLNTPTMRRNVDIHLTIDDKVIKNSSSTHHTSCTHCTDNW